MGQLVPLSTPEYAADPATDLAYFPGALGASKTEFMPILTPDASLSVRVSISFGNFALDGRELEQD